MDEIEFLVLRLEGWWSLERIGQPRLSALILTATGRACAVTQDTAVLRLAPKMACHPLGSRPRSSIDSQRPVRSCVSAGEAQWAMRIPMGLHLAIELRIELRSTQHAQAK